MTETETSNAALMASLPLTPLGYHLLPHESPDILVDVRAIIPDAELWLDIPNTVFMGDTPRSLIGTDREIRLRDVLRAVMFGLYS
ncbi:MAG TPA: hypothetical protein DDY78_05845 [Planctomycetales bacterium]|jgi:hypothetical protein|nr:hypothetical protein [Planctomycetales bacterium]